MSFVEQRQTGVVRYELFDEFDCRPRPPVLVWAPQMKKIRPVRTQNSRGTRFSVLQKTLANNGHVFAWHARKCFRYISCDIRAIDEHRLAFSNPMRRRGIRGQTKSYVTTTHFFRDTPIFRQIGFDKITPSYHLLGPLSIDPSDSAIASHRTIETDTKEKK